MKTYKYIALAAALALVGCQGEGFLSNQSPSAMDAAAVFSSESRTEQAVFGVYNLMGNNNSYRNRMACGYQGMNTDIEWSTKTTDSKTGVLMQYDCPISQSDVSNANGSDIWSYLNTMIERSNNIIEGVEKYGELDVPAVDKADQKKKESLKYLLGEAYFLRSFAYLEQIKFWGDVPARFSSLAADVNGVNVKKADRNEIYEHLRADLKRAAELMPWSEDCPLESAKNNVGRASKAAALSLLARMDLMYAGKAVRPGANGFDVNDAEAYAVTFNIADPALRAEVYKEALEACAAVINHDDHKLAADFATPFKQICQDVTDYGAMEHIWVMPFSDGSRGQVLNYNAPKLSSNAMTTVPGHLPGFGQGGSSNGHVCVSPALIFKFDSNDKRRDVTYVIGQWEYDDASTAVFKNDEEKRKSVFNNLDNATPRLYQKVNDISKFYLGKYRFEWMRGRQHTGTDDGVDFPVIRYADVLLMFAEAAIGGVGGDRPVNNTGLMAEQQFNKVRTRAGVAPINGEPTMQNIMDERAFELCGEYVRKYDLMRWGLLKQTMVDHEKYIRDLAADPTRHAMNIGDSLYFHYVYNEEIGGYEARVDGGLAPGQQNRPSTQYSYPGISKDIFNSDTKGYALNASNYPIFKSEDQLETRQYWPIFSTNVSISNGTLWNNYGYK